MAKSLELVDALKKVLRTRGMTYRELAVRLELSEASVKRLFSQKGFTLKRFDAICEAAGVELSDLIAAVESQRLIRALTVAQEQELVADLRLLLITISCLNRWSFEQILATYLFTEAELIQALAKLDRMKLIELQPGNRVKLLISNDFSWQKGGSIQRFFESQVQTEFFRSSFDGPGELRLFVNGMLSRASNALICQRMERLAQEFRQLHLDDQRIPLEERHGTSLALAIRPWELSVFENMRREGTHKVF
jgi:DNA-binding Xre family transcriptional regulator